MKRNLLTRAVLRGDDFDGPVTDWALSVCGSRIAFAGPDDATADAVATAEQRGVAADCGCDPADLVVAAFPGGGRQSLCVRGPLPEDPVIAVEDDFGEAATERLDLAVAVAARLSGRLLVLHVAPVDDSDAVTARLHDRLSQTDARTVPGGVRTALAVDAEATARLLEDFDVALRVLPEDDGGPRSTFVCSGRTLGAA